MAGPATSTEHWLLDDGLMELELEYYVQYVQGEPNSQAIAIFHHRTSKKLVRLRPGASISVNGKALEELLGTSGHGHVLYQVRIPTTDDAFTFALSREARHVVTHHFELPTLGLDELPKSYRPSEGLRVPVKYVEPPQHVISDRYSLAVYGKRRFRLMSSTRDNGRRPDIQDGAVVFRRIIDSAPGPGVYAAAVERQQGVDLSKLSDASPTGYALLTNTQPFRIAVK